MRARLGMNLLCGGACASLVGLVTGLGAMFHYFYVTPAATCAAAFARMSVLEVWPWLLPLFAFELTALFPVAAGFLLLVKVSGVDLMGRQR